MTTRYPFASVDLSKLPAPTILKGISYEKILAERTTELRTLFDKWGIPYSVHGLETDPSIIHQEEDAYREMIDLQSINYAATANMVAYSTGSNLDNLAALVGLRRLVIVPATATTPAVYQSDQELRDLMRVALDGASIGLTGGSYKLIALQAAPEVQNIGVIRTSPGHITVVLLGRGHDGHVTQETINKVNAAIQADKGAQLTDIVSVTGATPIFYDVDIEAYIPPGPSIADVKEAIIKSVTDAAAEMATIGGDVRTSALIAAGRLRPITRFFLRKPLDHIVPGPYGVAILNSVTVSINIETDQTALDNAHKDMPTEDGLLHYYKAILTKNKDQ